MTAKRRKEVENLSFQRIKEAEDRLRIWFGIEIFKNLKHEDEDFLNREFNRRHLLIHTAGRVDEEYIQKTGDDSVKVNQTIRIRSSEMRGYLSLYVNVQTTFLTSSLACPNRRID
jgi:hypothetical protein